MREGVERPARVATLRAAANVFFCYPSPRILAVHSVAACAARLWWGGFAAGDILVVAAVFGSWPFIEWFLHQNLLHMKPKQVGRWTLDPKFAQVHRYHHRHPWNLRAVFLPPQVPLVLAPIHISLWLFLLPTALALTGIWALATVALMYEWIHYLTHTSYRPRSGYFARVKTWHHWHHFRNEKYWHAFTVPQVDVWMGTGPEPRSVAHSPTARDLGHD